MSAQISCTPPTRDVVSAYIKHRVWIFDPEVYNQLSEQILPIFGSGFDGQDDIVSGLYEKKCKEFTDENNTYVSAVAGMTGVDHSWHQSAIDVFNEIFENKDCSWQQILVVLEFVTTLVTEQLTSGDVNEIKKLLDWVVNLMTLQPVTVSGQTIEAWVTCQGGWNALVIKRQSSRPKKQTAKLTKNAASTSHYVCEPIPPPRAYFVNLNIENACKPFFELGKKKQNPGGTTTEYGQKSSGQTQAQHQLFSSQQLPQNDQGFPAELSQPGQRSSLKKPASPPQMTQSKFPRYELNTQSDESFSGMLPSLNDNSGYLKQTQAYTEAATSLQYQSELTQSYASNEYPLGFPEIDSNVPMLSDLELCGHCSALKDFPADQVCGICSCGMRLCLLPECYEEFTNDEALNDHMQQRHSVQQEPGTSMGFVDQQRHPIQQEPGTSMGFVDQTEQCRRCGACKNRNSFVGLTDSQCEQCSAFWCFVDGCAEEFMQYGSLKSHQQQQHTKQYHQL